MKKIAKNHNKFRLTETIPCDIIILQGHLTMSQQNPNTHFGAKLLSA